MSQCKSIGCGLCRKCTVPLQQVWEKVQNSLATEVIETHRRQKDVEFSHVNYLGAIGAENDSQELSEIDDLSDELSDLEFEHEIKQSTQNIGIPPLNLN